LKAGGESLEQRYTVEMQAEIGPLRIDTDTLAAQDATDLQLSLDVSVQAVRTFRDGSVGKRVVFTAAELKQNGQVAEGLELQGRAVELRTFPDGEILAIGWIDRIAGADRFMDVFEVMFPAISPAPPSVKANQSVKRRIIWPFLTDDGLRWDSAVDAVWSNQGLEEKQNRKAWHLTYEGPWRIHGGRRGRQEVIHYRATGSANGTAWFDKGTGDLIEHSFEWGRTVILKGPGGEAEQDQAFRGTVERVR